MPNVTAGNNQQVGNNYETGDGLKVSRASLEATP